MAVILSRRSLLLCLSLPLLGGWPYPAALAQADELPARARGFVDALGKDALATIADKTIPRAGRLERFRAMFHKGFDITTIARFVLGRYWNLATPVQQQEYLKQFEEMVVRTYAARFDAYRGEQFRVVSSRPDADRDVFVITEVLPPNGPAITVEWRVREREARLAIIDVVVGGVSMSVTQRQEFASVIQAKGGNIDAFLQALRDKNAAMASSN